MPLNLFLGTIIPGGRKAVGRAPLDDDLGLHGTAARLWD
jgi:hypothetical protein